MRQLMLEKAKIARKNAYAPYSNYFVGVCLRTDDDQLFIGSNVENASYGGTMCAEVSAIGSLISAGKRKIAEVLILGANNNGFLAYPCGICRQLLSEFTAPEVLIHIATEEGVMETYTFASLLPKSYGPEQLQSNPTCSHDKEPNEFVSKNVFDLDIA